MTHAYGGTGLPAVEGMSIHVNEGEFAAIVGPSGCGKSTVMKLATGLQFPQAGEIVVAGKRGHRAGQDLRHGVPEPDAAALAHDAGKPAAAARDRAAASQPDALATRTNTSPGPRPCCRRWGCKGMGEKFPWQLSGGMQQRASLCRALIHEPSLLLLDEPFGALDAFTREELWCVIRDLHAARKVTVILVTHDLREAVFLADRIFCMSARPGRIIAERVIDLPRPRDLEVTYTREFTDIVHELRGHIAHARTTA